MTHRTNRLFFSPAELFINNLGNGRTYHAGGLNVVVLRGVLG